MLRSKFVASEIAKDTTLCTQLERLNEFRTQLVAEELSAYTGNAALKAARAALDDARAAYQKAATAFVLDDYDYKQFQTEIVRLAIHNFGTTHSMPGFVSWFDNKITVDNRWLPIKLKESGEYALRIKKRFIEVKSLDSFKRYCDIDGAFACYGWRICEQVLKYGKPA